MFVKKLKKTFKIVKKVMHKSLNFIFFGIVLIVLNFIMA